MKKILSIVALFVATAAMAEPEEVLTGINSLEFVPAEFTVNNKTVAYAKQDDNIIIYDDNFNQKAVIKPIVQTPVNGSCQVEATVKITGVKMQSSYSNGRYSYWDSEAMQQKEIQASSLTDMVKKLSARETSYTFVPFTDVNGLPSCYSYSTQYGTAYNSSQFYMYDKYMTAYPTSYYTLEDGYVCRRSTSYTIDFDASTAEWKEIPGTRTTYSSGDEINSFEYMNENSQSDNSFSISQTLFNNDDSWEYVTAEYGEPVVKVYEGSYYNTTDNGDGTVTLKTNANIYSEKKSLQVKNDKGMVVMTLPAGYIHTLIKYYNKYYLDMYKQTPSSSSSKNGHTLIRLDKTATSSPSKGIRGDVNGDGVVNMTDANEVVNMYLGK